MTEKKSTHQAIVYRIREIQPHENADKLGIVHVGGFQVVVNLADWKIGNLAVHIQPDTMVPINHPSFSFLAPRVKNGDTHFRVKTVKLRGVYSQGFFVPAPIKTIEGQDVSDILGTERYVPIEEIANGVSEKPPVGHFPKYDVESYEKYSRLIPEDEVVVITEKLHGASGRVTWRSLEDRLFVGSRSMWKSEFDQKGTLCQWWHAIRNTPGLEEWCKQHPDLTVYGEIYGWLQDLKYGAKNRDDIWFRAFDIWTGTEWMAPDEARTLLPLDVWVPMLAIAPYSDQRVRAELEKTTAISRNEIVGHHGGHIAEGIVIEPLNPIISKEIGRVKVKLISNEYASR